MRVGAAPSTVRETLRSASAAGLFSLLESGRCDMIEPVTNLPARALRGDFTPIPAFHAPVYVGLKPNSTVQKPEDLNA